jgi:fructose-specific component phosphotransferase system IIB-like protein
MVDLTLRIASALSTASSVNGKRVYISDHE